MAQHRKALEPADSVCSTSVSSFNPLPYVAFQFLSAFTRDIAAALRADPSAMLSHWHGKNRWRFSRMPVPLHVAGGLSLHTVWFQNTFAFFCKPPHDGGHKGLVCGRSELQGDEAVLAVSPSGKWLQ